MERQTGRQTDRDRQTDRQRQRHSETQRQRDSETETGTETGRGRQRQRQTDKQTETEIETDRQTDRQKANRQRQTETTSSRAGHAPTWESFRPSLEASFFLSGLLMYFCRWNIFSRPFRWASEKTALLSIPRLGLPRMVDRNVNGFGMGSSGDPETRSTHVPLEREREIQNLKRWFV